MRILTDVDETILQYSDAMQRYLEQKHGMFTDKRLRDYHNMQAIFGLDIPTLLGLVKEFHVSEGMRYLEPEPCAKEVLPQLYKQGYRFIAISACHDDPITVAHRIHNLREAFGFEWEEVICTGLKWSKKEALEKYTPTIWVDDLMRHASTGADLGYRSFLLDRPHNRSTEYPGVTRVNNWYEIAEHIL